ncbi:GIY-YIG nuclease family protein [Sphingobium yanoikuyae]|uniref:GIY-YIG nuclease family protein n=1 Tax=Sphingobium yanoikuyae TaxID=13690 RepID=UPI0028B248B1|nr:GIY-YIG nuclease family protein [Sphingobium yanoikuyae]
MQDHQNTTGPEPAGGIIYVLTNDAMPGMVKIGRTSGEGVERRVAELSRATGVPLPFKVAVARTVHDAHKVEKALHIAFGPDRVNPSREFFSISEHRAVAIINAFPGDDLTPQTERAVEREVEAAEPGTMAAVKSFEKKRRPPLNFEEMGVPLGSTLVHAASGETVEVVEAKKVLLRGEMVSLTMAQRIVSGAPYAVQPGRHWLFNGTSIGDLYEATYPHEGREE